MTLPLAQQPPVADIVLNIVFLLDIQVYEYTPGRLPSKLAA